MASITGIASRTVNEGSALKYTATLKDEGGTVLALSAVNTITLTLFEVPGQTIINSQNGTNILNLNNGTFAATSGAFTMLFLAADNPIVNAAGEGDLECHEALFKITYSTTKTLNHTVRIYVRQLDKVA